MSETVTPLQPTSKFEILRRRSPVNASAKYTSAYLTAQGAAAVAGTETAPRGLGLGAHATDPDYFDLAGPNDFIGHLTRRVLVGGLTLADRVFGVTSPTPVGVESAFQDGLEVSLETGEEIEVEGLGVYLYSGSNMITTATTPGTGLTFQNGMLRVAQATELVPYTLTANNLTPVDTGALRIRAVHT